MEKDSDNTIVVQCYPYGELIYIVKSMGEVRICVLLIKPILFFPFWTSVGLLHAFILEGYTL